MTALLTARDVCQRLREAALGVRMFNRDDTCADIARVAADIEGWRLLLDFEGERLHHCEHCRCPDGREWHFNTRYGTDPVSLLSTWELAQIENLLKR
ncbi:DUF7693 family protein [Pseudomonas sp. GM30]|uniref:DUF7693 family protein n=1 Tax=Pseudomonas sp. GM30 TaxID=1144328 RepID=UPI0002701CBD|nr:hypothetical protein [Pseudomonas sp. GM30]EUB83415.1 hypothetical protein PMI25_002746 [Pseudomonas sp. GM30]